MSDDEQLPKSDEVLKGIVMPAKAGSSGISKPEKEYIRRVQSISVDGQVQYAHLRGIQDHYKHKGRWSNFLIAAIAAMLVFQSFLLFQVGTQKWTFVEYDWLLPALLVQNLAQVVGLSVWAVKYLFSDISNQRTN